MNKEVFIGPISINTKGVGFFDREPEKKDRENSVEIQPENINRAFHGDIVEIELTGEKIKNREQGKVIKIITRARDEFVGTVSRTVLDTGEEKVFVVPDDKRLYVDIFLSAIHQSVGEVSEDDKVLVKIKKWDTLEGEVIKVIGKAGENNTEMEAIVLEKGFRIEFPAEVEREAEKIRGAYKATATTEIAKRRDMRNVTTMTIDPFDAKDFDDAISFVDLGNNTFEIGVHIADVSYFVTPNTPLDHESEKRGLSVYLVDRTIPMLPEILSNDLCSLNANEDKFTFSAVFKMDNQGKVLDEWFGRTVIHSDKRFTYEEANDVIIGKQTGPHKIELLKLNEIAKKLQKANSINGAVNFEKDEVKFELDSAGKPLRVYKKSRLDTHKLVEEFMLLANRAVAKFIFMSQNKNLMGKGKQSVYRIHAKPDKERIENLVTFLKALGFNLKNKEGAVMSKDINTLLKEVEGTPNEELIKTATIRSMAKAAYSTKNIGHFGLAFTYYTHFTSPIRRYPDLIVHRFLERELKGGKIEQNEYEKFERICLASSELEKKASDAERASIKYKQVEYMQDHIGKEFDGTITGVVEWGIYIEEKETKCEGMIKLRDLGNDFYTLDEKNYTIKGEKTGKKFTLGDTVRFKVVSADLEKRVLDYALV
ncbi:MAG: Ribonuclease R [Parcubacteria group bacterium GW2011_GWF2_39_8b]|uniref:Ribonuclease R n=3 Tax=Candidatus Zambryskiibacteriota TaxID=1817925 RepID=A0A1G2T5T3_9BACT|nr:MAG: Ribonuclease R [Parcubacteria group bacterium GW2011_GWF2_39_8b]KKR45946.1 MAG: Ribonuclease R [Parcubacteria group bacterium GW2011_GWA2_40_14]OHA92656.1 MAG: ribonuclease R [Candidatus Zambryskibacteria bacterium RIFCSPHIGHO2_02_38_10.5]OHA97110.1 MAG: ribonuclease R [Candidatus Zambryskibacteria bacterium RIFCSPHIGHO2_02_FULL_39_82]OHA97687.1 MAG: ribonuclease R [Candidatus Zambryskibacteria bacterium RIFCSPHIGHO2_12_FULL_38_37]OHB08578.1 MAG: ribonuclease R [Candidatus Zambryskibac